MNSVPRIRSVLPAFRLVAHLEAASWAGLLAGMLLKYGVPAYLEVGTRWVSVFGSIHGALVILYVALALLLGLTRRWGPKTFVLAVAATVPPFLTVVFDRWALRTGRYDEAGSPASRS